MLQLSIILVMTIILITTVVRQREAGREEDELRRFIRKPWAPAESGPELPAPQPQPNVTHLCEAFKTG